MVERGSRGWSAWCSRCSGPGGEGASSGRVQVSGQVVARLCRSPLPAARPPERSLQAPLALVLAESTIWQPLSASPSGRSVVAVVAVLVMAVLLVFVWVVRGAPRSPEYPSAGLSALFPAWEAGADAAAYAGSRAGVAVCWPCPYPLPPAPSVPPCSPGSPCRGFEGEERRATRLRMGRIRQPVSAGRPRSSRPGATRSAGLKDSISASQDGRPSDPSSIRRDCTQMKPSSSRWVASWSFISGLIDHHLAVLDPPRQIQLLSRERKTFLRGQPGDGLLDLGHLTRTELAADVTVGVTAFPWTCSYHHRTALSRVSGSGSSKGPRRYRPPGSPSGPAGPKLSSRVQSPDVRPLSASPSPRLLDGERLGAGRVTDHDVPRLGVVGLLREVQVIAQFGQRRPVFLEVRYTAIGAWKRRPLLALLSSYRFASASA